MRKTKHKKDYKKVSAKRGLSAGSLVFVGEAKMPEVKISVIEYNENSFKTSTFGQIEAVLRRVPAVLANGVTWLNIDGLHDIALIEQVGQHFGIDRLTLEDLLNTTQRPKLDDFESYVFLVVKVLNFNKTTMSLEIEQISFVLGKNFVLSFQELEGDTFNSVRQRLHKSGSLLRRRGADFLLYALLDTIVDNYFVITEALNEKIEDLEERLLYENNSVLINEIYALKKELGQLRKSIYPLREVIVTLDHNESQILSSDTKWFIRDIYDHTLQVIDHIDTFKDSAGTLLELYMSNISNKMNEVMKVLTVISTIFIPLTFIVGVYGMNFKNMPETEWEYGYFLILGLMVLAAVGMIYYFRRKKWL